MKRSVYTSCLCAALLLGGALSGTPAMAQERSHMGGAVTTNSRASSERHSAVSRESMSRQAAPAASSSRSAAPARSYSRPQVSRPATTSQPARTYSQPARSSGPVRSYSGSNSARSTAPVRSYSQPARSYSQPQVSRPATTSGRSSNGGSMGAAQPYSPGTRTTGGSGTRVNPYAGRAASTTQPVRSYGSSSSISARTTEPVRSANRSASQRVSSSSAGRDSWQPGAQPSIGSGNAHSDGVGIADRQGGGNKGNGGGSGNAGKGGNRGKGGAGTYEGNKGFNPNFKGDRSSFDRGTYRGRPDGDRGRWDERRNYYDRYGYRSGWEPRRGYGDRFFDHYRHGWMHPVRPPYRPWRPQVWVYTRPAIPYGWAPYRYAPIVDGILGLYFGTLYNETLNFLYYNNYTIDGYYDGTVYVRDVDLFGYAWPDVELRYDDYNALNYAQFSYSMGYCDMGRYNAIYRLMCDNYGRPVMVVSGAYPRVTWIGGDSRGYITLSMNGADGRWYTSLSFGY